MMCKVSQRRLDKPLTKREEEVLNLYLDGKSRKEICSLMWITKQTLSHHFYFIDRKLERELLLW